MRLQKQATSACLRQLTLWIARRHCPHIVDVALVPLEGQPPEKEGDCVVQ